jgi:voltage-gated potassium channel
LISDFEKEILFYKGDAFSVAVLKAAGIERSKNLICSLPNDADNLFVVLSARKLKPDIVIFSRVSEEQNQSKLEWAGADHVIMPDKIGGGLYGRIANGSRLDSFYRCFGLVERRN